MARFEDTFPTYAPFGSRNLKLSAVPKKGTDVAVLQSLFNVMRDTMEVDLGAPINIDGIYGSATAAAVRRIQSYFKLAVDGIAGPQTYFAFGQGVKGNVTYGGPAFGSRTLSQGMSGGDVTVLENRLNCFRYSALLGGPADGVYNIKTFSAVQAFQTDAVANGDTGLAADGVVGPATFDALWIYTFAGGRGLFSGRNGFDVVFVQVILRSLGFYTGKLDGFYGPKTITAVQDFQDSEHITVDGVVGQQTFYRLGLRNQNPAPKPLETVIF
ncbi:MAG: peptidoglycan-binding domain-containing protein [Bacillota bacterium]